MTETPTYAGATQIHVDEHGSIVEFATNAGPIRLRIPTESDADDLTEIMYQASSDIADAVYEAEIRAEEEEEERQEAEERERERLEQEAWEAPAHDDADEQETAPATGHDPVARPGPPRPAHPHKHAENPMRSRQMLAVGLLMSLLAVGGAVLIAFAGG